MCKMRESVMYSLLMSMKPPRKRKKKDECLIGSIHSLWLLIDPGGPAESGRRKKKEEDAP